MSFARNKTGHLSLCCSRGCVIGATRCWWQFSLRTLLVFALPASVGMSWYAVNLERVRRNEAAPKARALAHLRAVRKADPKDLHVAYKCAEMLIALGRHGEATEIAGLNHMMTLELAGNILPGDRFLRISSNMELYWEPIFLAVHRDDAELSVQEVAPGEADLHFLGYRGACSPDGRRPKLYDYNTVHQWAPRKRATGNSTRFGDVTELLEEADDCYVIMGPGEEVTLPLPTNALSPVPANFRCQNGQLLQGHGSPHGPWRDRRAPPSAK